MELLPLHPLPASLKSAQAGCAVVGTPDVLMPVMYRCVVTASDWTPPNDEPDGFGRRAAGSVPALKSDALPEVATVAKLKYVLIDAALGSCVVVNAIKPTLPEPSVPNTKFGVWPVAYVQVNVPEPVTGEPLTEQKLAGITNATELTPPPPPPPPPPPLNAGGKTPDCA